MSPETGEKPMEAILTEEQRQQNLQSVAELGGVDVKTVESVAEKLSAEAGSAEKSSTDTGVGVGDQVALKIEGVLVPDAKVVGFDEKVGIVTVQMPGAEKPMPMSSVDFDLAHKQAQHEAEVQAVVSGKKL